MIGFKLNHKAVFALPSEVLETLGTRSVAGSIDVIPGATSLTKIWLKSMASFLAKVGQIKAGFGPSSTVMTKL